MEQGQRLSVVGRASPGGVVASRWVVGGRRGLRCVRYGARSLRIMRVGRVRLSAAGVFNVRRAAPSDARGLMPARDLVGADDATPGRLGGVLAYRRVKCGGYVVGVEKLLVASSASAMGDRGKGRRSIGLRHAYRAASEETLAGRRCATCTRSRTTPGRPRHRSVAAPAQNPRPQSRRLRSHITGYARRQ
jgi:hypothetical protein